MRTLVLLSLLLFPSIGYTATGPQLIRVSPPLTKTAGLIACPTAATAQAGCLSSTDWNTFNSKAGLASPTFTGTVTVPVTASRALVTGSASELAASATTAAQIGFLSTLSSNAQTQLDAKAPLASPTFSGTITTPLTASRALVLGASSELAASATTAAQVGFLSTLSSDVQTQINAKAPSASPTFSGTITTPLTASRVVKTTAGSALTTGAVDLANSSEASGVLPFANLSLTGMVEALTGFIQTAADQSFTLDQKAAYGYTVQTIDIVSSSGTVTAALKINGTNITGCSAVSVSSSPATGTCTAANSVSAGAKLTVLLSSNAAAVNVAFTIKTTRN